MTLVLRIQIGEWEQCQFQQDAWCTFSMVFEGSNDTPQRRRRGKKVLYDGIERMLQEETNQNRPCLLFYTMKDIMNGPNFTYRKRVKVWILKSQYSRADISPDFEVLLKKYGR